MSKGGAEDVEVYGAVSPIADPGLTEEGSMAIRVRPYQCNQCEARFLKEEPEVCSSGSAFGFHSTDEDVKCPRCGGREVQALEFNSGNVRDLSALYLNRFGRKGGG